MKTVAIVQARMGSSRFPGKPLLDIGGKTMLARVVGRVRQAALLDEIVVATSLEPSDESILLEGKNIGSAVFRGSEEDVLDRFYQAATTFQADVIVRITADCPLIDGALIDHILRSFHSKRPDYASNTLTRTYPRGLDAEVIGRDALDRVWRAATQPYERAHVTPYIYQNPFQFNLLSVTSENDNSAHRWTVDTQEDLKFVRAVYERFANKDLFNWLDVLEVLSREEPLIHMNSHIRQKSLEQG